MFLAIVLCGLAAEANGQFRAIEVDAGKVVGEIRSLQGVNGGPVPLVPRLAHVGPQYRDLRIDLVRTHDFFGPTDIDAAWPDPDKIARSVRADGSKSIFPNWEADPEKESSYNWGPTDEVLRAIVDCGAEVFYRVGRSWSADPSPPPDFDKYANIVKHVAMHYNDGWANGFHYNIRYWEIWNEPDAKEAWYPGYVRPFWSGTPGQFYQLYEKVARTLKSYDPKIKVGGPAQAAGGHSSPYREGLISYCADHRVPLDFFSWHRYPRSSLDPYDFVRIGEDVRRLLDARGFRHAENILDEWNYSLRPGEFNRQFDPAIAAAFLAAALVYLQDSPVDRSFYYRGDAVANGLFERDGSYRDRACAYKALGAMLDTRERLAATGGDTLGLAVLAGRSADGNTVQVLISNYEIPESHRNRPRARTGGLQPRNDIQYSDNRGFRLKVQRLPWGNGKFTVNRYRTTPTENWVEARSSGDGDTVDITGPLPPPGLELIVLRRG